MGQMVKHLGSENRIFTECIREPDPGDWLTRQAPRILMNARLWQALQSPMNIRPPAGAPDPAKQPNPADVPP